MRRTLLEPAVLELASPRDLLQAYEAIRHQLRLRSVVRTNDAPAGQYAEWLALTCLGGSLATNSEKGYDLSSPRLGRVQVKCRVIRSGRMAERQLSPFRSLDGFDVALVILFDPDYEVLSATLLTAEHVATMSKHIAHVNGHVMIARPASLAVGVDMTELFRPSNTVAVPVVEQWDREWMEFALTYDGYRRHGFDGCADIANMAASTYELTGELPNDLEELRTCLFFEQRRERFTDGDAAFDPYLAGLLSGIAGLSGGTVRDDRPIRL